jgi:hypothetical protein
VLVFGVLLGGMVGYLFLQTTLQQQAFALNGLRDETSILTAREAYLEATLATQATPRELARAAAAVGMVANPYAVYLVVPTGEVRGVVHPVAGNELPGISTPPPSATRAAAAVAAPAAAQPAADTPAADTPADAPPPDAADANAGATAADTPAAEAGAEPDPAAEPPPAPEVEAPGEGA